MLRICKNKTEFFILDVNEKFDNLTFNEIKRYIPFMLELKAINRIVGISENNQKVFQVGCETDFGLTTLDNISTSVKILVLSKMFIEKKQYVCFPDGLIGDNFMPYLENICERTNYVYLYAPDGLLRQFKYKNKRKLERCVYKGIIRDKS